jgi:hypothetical protein
MPGLPAAALQLALAQLRAAGFNVEEAMMNFIATQMS